MQDSTKISLGMGDDNGAFTPTAFAFTGCDEARAIIEAIVFMLNQNGIDVDVVQGGGFEGSGQVPDVPRGTVNNNGGNPNWEESGDRVRVAIYCSPAHGRFSFSSHDSDSSGMCCSSAATISSFTTQKLIP